MKLEQVHDGGRNEVFLEVKPKALVWGDKDRSFHRLEYFRGNNKSNGRFKSGTNNKDTTQDQFIVFGTIATMALFVGMLSAKRLRNQRLLEHCMESDLEEWEDQEDLNGKKKKDGGVAPENQSIHRGFGEVMGGNSSGGNRRYESFGNLHWRGDMEKFDV